MRNQDILGSPSAMSIAAATNPAIIPVVAIVAGVAMVGAAAEFGFHKIEQYKKEKHHHAIEKNHAIWEKTLSKIMVKGSIEPISLPPIFQYNKETDEYETMRFTESQVMAMSNNALACPDDPVIVNYKKLIVEAIRSLKDYYAGFHDKKRLTVCVIEYLLNILETKSLNFQGYAFDIALIDGLIRFNYTFASLKGLKSQRFKHLTKVNRSLKQAKRELERHQQLRTQPEFVQALLGACRSTADYFIRFPIKVFAQEEYWGHIDNQTWDELTKGIIVSQFQRRIGPFCPQSGPFYSQCDTINQWLHQIVPYFLETMNPDKSDILAPDLTIFSFPTTLSSNQEIFWKKLFTLSDNFVTQHLDETENFSPISDVPTMLSRMSFLSKIAKLVHMICSLQWMLTGVSQYIKMYGLYLTDNPAHCTEMYANLDQLTQKLIQHLDEVETDFFAIEFSQKDAMLMAGQEEFRREFDIKLRTFRSELINNITEIKNRRKNFSSHTAPETPRTAEKTLLSRFTRIKQLYDINISTLPAPVERSEEAERIVERTVETAVETEQPEQMQLSEQPLTPASINSVDSVAPTLSLSDLKKYYENQASFFNSSKKIFTANRDTNTVIKLLTERAEKNPKGASKKTLDYYARMTSPVNASRISEGRSLPPNLPSMT